jgi:hypothetical protein
MTGAKARDAVVALLLLLLGGSVYIAAVQLPPGRFDPLGSGAIPQALAAGLAILALVLLLSSLTGGRDLVAEAATATQGPVSRGRTGRLLGVLVLLILYGALLSGARGSFPWVTPAFVLTVALLLGGLSTRTAVAGLLVGLLLGPGLQLLLTRVFFVPI